MCFSGNTPAIWGPGFELLEVSLLLNDVGRVPPVGAILIKKMGTIGPRSACIQPIKTFAAFIARFAVTSAMQAGIMDRVWDIADLLS